MQTTTILTGYDAIDWAEFYGTPLNKYADPTEGERSGITADEAFDICDEDPSLVWTQADGDK